MPECIILRHVVLLLCCIMRCYVVLLLCCVMLLCSACF
jgi:hypothetical protein